MAKRKALSIEEKLEIVESLEKGEKQCDLCKRLGLVKSTVGSIWAARDKIKQQVLTGQISVNAKKQRKSTKEDIDASLLKWFQQQRNANRPISGPILQAKAEQLGKLLGHQEFICSSGWIDRFKSRHNIVSGKVSGEAAAVNGQIVEGWMKKEWPKVCEKYPVNDIYNADETGLFYKMCPSSTLKFKNEKCVGGKLSKQRVTVLVCANMSGTEKRQLLVIGKSRSPRCFKNVTALPVKYANNRRAWMTSSIFEEELRSWDRELQRDGGRKIALLLDNCAAHPHLFDLKNIELVFLPPQTTSVLQPMDQGIIRSLKCHYR